MTGNSIWIEGLVADKQNKKSGLTEIPFEQDASELAVVDAAPQAPEVVEENSPTVSILPVFDAKKMSAKNYRTCVFLETIADRLNDDPKDKSNYFRYAVSKKGNCFGVRVKTPRFKQLLALVGEEFKPEVRNFERLLLAECMTLGASVQVFLSGAVCTWQHQDDGRKARRAS